MKHGQRRTRKESRAPPPWGAVQAALGAGGEGVPQGRGQPGRGCSGGAEPSLPPWAHGALTAQSGETRPQAAAAGSASGNGRLPNTVSEERRGEEGACWRSPTCPRPGCTVWASPAPRSHPTRAARPCWAPRFPQQVALKHKNERFQSRFPLSPRTRLLFTTQGALFCRKVRGR